MSSLRRLKMLMAREIPPIGPDYLAALTLDCKKPPPTSYPGGFPRFSKLLIELRLKIWTQAALDVPGRIIPLSCTSGSPARFHTKSPYPMLAIVCYEARVVVADVLPRLFPGRHVNGQQVIIADHEKDVSLLASDFTNQHLKILGEKLDSEKEKIFAVAHESGNVSSGFLTRNFDAGSEIFYTFPKLETLIVILVRGNVHPETGVELGERATRKSPLKFRATSRTEEKRNSFKNRVYSATRAYFYMKVAYFEVLLSIPLSIKKLPEIHFQKLALEVGLDCSI